MSSARATGAKYLPAELTVGDIVKISAGDIVPADLRLLETYDLEIDEAVLSGEAVAAEKDAANLVPCALSVS